MLDFSILRPESKYPPYPGSYVNTKEYLEEYFYNYYINNILDKKEIKRYYIPIFWTPLYVDNHKIDIQKYINALDWNKKWFTVCQMDDGILYKLPTDTFVFHAGGNTGNGMKIPIPLIASQIPNNLKNNNLNKDIFASFVGSMTHPIRKIGYDLFHNNKNFYFNSPQSWSQTVTDSALKEFIEITQRSIFTLCFAGYGDSSFRLYQAMELGSIPVYICHRQHWLPWADELDWNKFCVLLKPDQIPDLYNILNNISEERRQQMKRKIQEIYPKYFTLEGMCDNILKRL